MLLKKYREFKVNSKITKVRKAVNNRVDPAKVIELAVDVAFYSQNFLGETHIYTIEAYFLLAGIFSLIDKTQEAINYTNICLESLERIGKMNTPLAEKILTFHRELSNEYSHSKNIEVNKKNETLKNIRFIINGDGTITDNNTGLMWEMTPSEEANTWRSKRFDIEDLTLGGYKDWRVPSCEELLALAEAGEKGDAPYSELKEFGFDNIKSGKYWTSLFLEYSDNIVFYVDFGQKKVEDHQQSIYEDGYVIAVRG